MPALWYSLGLLACDEALDSRSLDNITFKMYKDKSYLGAYKSSAIDIYKTITYLQKG